MEGFGHEWPTQCFGIAQATPAAPGVVSPTIQGTTMYMVSKYRSNWLACHPGYQGVQTLVDSQAGVDKLTTGHRHSGKQPQTLSIDRTTTTTDFIHRQNHDSLQGF